MMHSKIPGPEEESQLLYILTYICLSPTAV